MGVEHVETAGPLLRACSVAISLLNGWTSKEMEHDAVGRPQCCTSKARNQVQRSRLMHLAPGKYLWHKSLKVKTRLRKRVTAALQHNIMVWHPCIKKLRICRTFSSQLEANYGSFRGIQVRMSICTIGNIIESFSTSAHSRYLQIFWCSTKS